MVLPACLAVDWTEYRRELRASADPSGEASVWLDCIANATSARRKARRLTSRLCH